MERKAVSGIMLTLLLTGMLTLAFNIQPAKTEPATIVVPDDYPTIQAAVDAANDGDTIKVKAGTYLESVVIDKTISLIGEKRSTTIIDSDENTVSIVSDSVNISGFTIRNSGIDEMAIYVDESENSSILDLKIDNPHGPAIIAHYSPGLKIQRNNISDNYGLGMHLRFSENSIIAENIINNNGKYGIWLFSSGNSTIKGNIVSNNYDSNIVIERSDGSLLEGNTANKVEFSVVLQDTKDNILRDNEISDSYVGLWVSTAFNCTIAGNSIQDNAIGVRIYGSGNIFYHNTFINNTMFQVQVPGHEENIWDDGYPSGGNFWSDYEDIYPDAEELDNSGIWNTPYVIDENNVDRYPLMEPITGLISRTIQIKDAETGLDSITLGSPNEPLPAEGYSFTVNLTLNGTTNYLHSFRVAVAFDKTKVKCNAVWIPKDDPSFVFYGAKFLMSSIGVYNDEGLVVLHSSLSSDYVVDGYPIRHYVNVTGDTLFGQINFTAIEPGASTLETISTQEPIYPTLNTVLIDKDNNPIDFTAKRFSVTAIALQPSLVTAHMHIQPHALNQKSRGKWITAYLELPEGYNVSDIDRSTILLNDTIPVDSFWLDKPLGSVIGDYDNDGISDLMVKFDRQALIEYLKTKGITDDHVTLAITGEANGKSFEVTDTIKVMGP